MTRPRVYLVDDSPEFLSVTRRYLAEEMELDVIGSAPSGYEALSEIPSLAPDLVLMDLTMPAMNGLEATRLLKAEPYAPRVIILTVHQSHEFQVAAKAAGADALINKAHIARQLQPIVRDLFGSPCDQSDRGPTKNTPKSPWQGQDLKMRLIENSLDAITLIDPSGTILFESPSVQRMLGFQPEDLVGHDAFQMIHADDLTRVHDAFAAALKNPGSPHRVEFRHLHQDGSWRYLESIGHCVHDEGATIVVVNSRDVTDRKELEQKVLHKQKLEIFGELAGGIAHDFNNVLTIITGYGELALDLLERNHPVREVIIEMQKAGERASNLIRQLLTFTRKQESLATVVDLNALVVDMEKMLRRLISEDINLAVKLSPRGPRIKADPGQVEQVIMNLVVNARDAMPRGGHLSIGTSIENINDPLSDGLPEISPGRYTVLTVSDDGCGMTAETRSRIFEPFFTTKERGKGTGLGLATVFGIVVQADGHIRVESEVGSGSTFRIYLPCVAEVAEAVATTPTPKRDVGGNETILVAEDDDNVRGIVARFLRSLGYQVLEAANGEDAVAVANRHPDSIDLLLTDLVMPQLGGLDLAGILQRHRRNTKVLFMSGYSGDVDVSQRQDHLIRKPFTPSTLANRVRGTLDVQE